MNLFVISVALMTFYLCHMCKCEPWWIQSREIYEHHKDLQAMARFVVPYAMNCSPIASSYDLFNPWTGIGVRFYSRSQDLLVIFDADISLQMLEQQACNVTISESSLTCVGHYSHMLYRSISASILHSNMFHILLRQHAYVVVSGHGFGGTLAQLFMFDISHLFKLQKGFLITFGSPAAGNVKFSQGVCKDVECIHIHNEHDTFWLLQSASFMYDQQYIFKSFTDQQMLNKNVMQLTNFYHDSYLGIQYCK